MAKGSKAARKRAAAVAGETGDSLRQSSGASARRLRRLERDLGAALRAERKRRRQLEAATIDGTKKGKRTRQLAAAREELLDILGRLSKLAQSAEEPVAESARTLIDRGEAALGDLKGVSGDTMRTASDAVEGTGSEVAAVAGRAASKEATTGEPAAARRPIAGPRTAPARKTAPAPKPTSATRQADPVAPPAMPATMPEPAATAEASTAGNRRSARKAAGRPAIGAGASRPGRRSPPPAPRRPGQVAVEAPADEAPADDGRRPAVSRRRTGRVAWPVVAAAVDVGSNSVHLLVAVVGHHRSEPLVDVSVFLGLGAAADQGLLGPEVRATLVAALVEYGEAARRLGATRITLVGTEPMRRALDAAWVVHEVERASGLPLHVLSHEEEGLLTLLGVTAGRPVHTDLAVVDVGGGSSEFVVVGPGRAARAFGVRVGGARLTERCETDDPPSPADISALRFAAGELLADTPDASIRELVAVGGTASNLLKVLPAAALDRTLTRRRLADAMAVMMAEPSGVASERHAINPVRARILPAGAAILEAILDRYGLDRLRVSEEGIREGTAFVTAYAGAAWRDRLETLAHGWDR